MSEALDGMIRLETDRIDQDQTLRESGWIGCLAGVWCGVGYAQCGVSGYRSCKGE